MLDEGVAGIERAYVDGDMARTMAGGVVGLLGFLLMLPVLVFLARTVGRRTETSGEWARACSRWACTGW